MPSRCLLDPSRSLHACLCPLSTSGGLPDASRCLPDASQKPPRSPGCLLGAPQVPPRCLQGASWVPLVLPRCLLGALLVRQTRHEPSARIEGPDSCGEISTMCQKTKEIVFTHSGPTNHCLGSHAGVIFWKPCSCNRTQRHSMRVQTHFLSGSYIQ